MSIVSRFTVTPLLYACGALLLVCLGMGVALKLQAGKLDLANAQLDTLTAGLLAAHTERDAWKHTAQGATSANAAATAAIASLKAALQQQQQAMRDNASANARAIAAAQADAADADRTLQLFTAKFQRDSRKPDCARALAELDAMCPTLKDY